MFWENLPPFITPLRGKLCMSVTVTQRSLQSVICCNSPRWDENVLFCSADNLFIYSFCFYCGSVGFCLLHQPVRLLTASNYTICPLTPCTNILTSVSWLKLRQGAILPNGLFYRPQSRQNTKYILSDSLFSPPSTSSISVWEIGSMWDCYWMSLIFMLIRLRHLWFVRFFSTLVSSKWQWYGASRVFSLCSEPLLYRWMLTLCMWVCSCFTG